MIELSIIVPVYKVEAYLPKCIESILSQTFTDFELILIDDGSPDRCGAICDEYAAKDSRIVVIHQKNQGVSAARNTGLNIARGSYIGFVDSDDSIDAEMYAHLLNCLWETQSDIAICGVQYIAQDGAVLRTAHTGDALLNREELLKCLYGKPNPIGGGCVNKLFSASVLNGIRFQEDIKMAEDWVFLFHVFAKAEKACHVDGAFYHVTERNDSATRVDEANAYYESMFEGKLQLLFLARSYSRDLEITATDKYMDDCLRYSNLIRRIGIKSNTPYRWMFFRLRLQILKRMPRVVIKHLFWPNKVIGYLISMVRKV